MDTAQILTDLRTQRERIDQAITALEALNGTVTAAKPALVRSAKNLPATPAVATKRVISTEARQRMAEAQQKRWAKKKRAVKVAAKKAVAPTETKSAKAARVASPAVKAARKPMSAATKKKLAAAARARWAAKKSATKRAPKKAAASVAAVTAKAAPKA